jgi:hypothetical protein
MAFVVPFIKRQSVVPAVAQTRTPAVNGNGYFRETLGFPRDGFAVWLRV